MGLFDILGGLFGGNDAYDAQAKANKQAIAAQTEFFNKALGEQQRQYDTTRSDFAPWRVTGGGALADLAKVYGLPTSGAGGQTTSGTGTPDFSSFMASPDYKFRQDESMKAINAYQAAHGMSDSGATYKAILDRSGSLASSEFGGYINHLLNLAGLGQSATASTAQAGENSANNISNLFTGQGNNLASSYIRGGNINASQSANQAGLYGQLGNQLFGSGNIADLFKFAGG